MNREDFPILKNNLIYFDNGATTLKPKCVIDKMLDYYTKYTANAHRGDYDNSTIVDREYEMVRLLTKELIDASDYKEIAFTSGATESLNIIVFGFMKYHLKKDDEVILSKSEHASNILPWMELARDIGIKIKYVPLNSNHEITMDNLNKTITGKTKVISLAHITNTIGDVRPIKAIGALCKKKGIYFVVDGAQSIPHLKISVTDLNIDFLAFSFHKMLGATGTGVLYGKYNLLEETRPLKFGGGMNNFFEADGSLEYKNIPTVFEAGTPNIEGVIASGAAIEYLNKITFEKIDKHVKELRSYLISKLEKIDNITIYNKEAGTTSVIFNIDNVFAQDTAIYLNTFGICIRAGNHCAKILKDELGIKNTCRITLYLYNTKEEIDKLIEALKDSKNIFKVVI